MDPGLTIIHLGGNRLLISHAK